MEKWKSKAWLLVLFLLSVVAGQSQVAPSAGVLTYSEYIGYVKKYHPMVRQANLAVDKAQAYLMEARGAFDPKLEFDFDSKQFKGTDYYEVLNSSFKIPTWYGVEVKAAFDRAEGSYVNPQNTTPANGLAAVGVSIPIGQGLWINERMTAVRQAKEQLKIGEAERRLMAADVLYDASVAYFDWVRAQAEANLYKAYTEVADERFTALQRLIQLGDKPVIDSIESGIFVKMRNVGYAEANLKLIKARLAMSNFLWIDQTPVEISDGMLPEQDVSSALNAALQLRLLNAQASVASNPKLLMIEGKLNVLDFERRFRQNQLLPKLDAGYYLLTEPDAYEIDEADYKLGITFSYPIFLRKERAKLKLSKIKIQEERFGLQFQRTQLANKLAALQTEISTLEEQIRVTASLTGDYRRLLEAEERMFALGESSLFLINSRENSLISSQLSEINLQNRLLQVVAEYYRTTADFP